MSKEDEERKKRRNQIIIGVILVGVMLFSTLGFALNSNPTDNSDSVKGRKVNYNGYEFTLLDNGLWYLNIGNSEFVFKYNPNEVERVPGFIKSLNAYSGLPLYISSESLEAEQEIYINLDNVILRRQYACINENNCKEGFPIKTCSDNFIIIEESNVTEISQNNSCVFIKAPKTELVKVTDEFLFKTIGVE